MHDLQVALLQGAEALGLVLSDRQQTQLLAYLDLLQKWGRVYNLTAVREPRDMLTHHLLDSLAVILPLRRQLMGCGQDTPSFLDVGSGAGLPGVVVAICCPDVTVSCLDAVAKKAAFVQQVAGSLGLSNLRGVHGRVEGERKIFDVVGSRAFASLADFVRLSSHTLATDGVWMAMKGKDPVEEVEKLPAEAQVFHVEPLSVPGLDAQRCIVWLRRLAPA